MVPGIKELPTGRQATEGTLLLACAIASNAFGTDFMQNAALYQATLDSLSVHVAVLDTTGTIIAVNEAWRGFARANGDPTLEKTGVGINYFDICAQCQPQDEDSEDARRARSGIDAVLQNETESFGLEYPCHSPQEQRWFLMYVTPLASEETRGIVVTHVNITNRKKLELQVREAETRYRNLFERVPVGLYRTTPNGQILDVNQALVEMLGYSRRQPILHQNATAFYVNPADRDRWRKQINRTGQLRDFEAQLRRQDGTILWVQDNAHAVRDDSGHVIYYEGNWQDVTERKRYEERLAYLAAHDPLTGLLNRRSFQEAIERLLAESPVDQCQRALIWLDLDHFKAVNDRFGHETGDRVLGDVSRILTSHSGKADLVARLGGDEFAILMAKADAENARALGEAVRLEVREALGTVSGSASVGIALFPQHGKSLEELLVRADEALYTAKERNRDQIALYGN